MEKIKQMLNSAIFKIILIALVIRLFGISYPYIAEESTYVDPLKLSLNEIMHSAYYPPGTFDKRMFVHPPIGMALYFISTRLFGITIESMRIIPLIFGLGVIYICYLFSRKIYDERSAIITSALLAISFYSVWSSLYIDLDGSILMFFVTATIYCYFKFRESNNLDKKALYSTAIFFGLAWLTKYTALLIIPILLLNEVYILVYKQKINIRGFVKSLIPLVTILFFGLIIFSIFPITMLFYQNIDAFLLTVLNGSHTIFANKAGHYHSISTTIISFAKNIFFILQYYLPAIPIIALYALKNRKNNETILFSWIVVFFVFYTVLAPEGGKVKYLSILIPPLYILSSKVISEIIYKIEKKDVLYISKMFILFTAIIVLLNMYGSLDVFGLKNMNVELILQNGLLWYSGRGSASFMVHMHSFIFVVVLSAILFVISLKKRYFKKAVLILLALTLTFNGFILFQSFYPTVGPQYEQTLKDLARDYKNSTEQLYGISFYRDSLNTYFGDSKLDYYTSGKKGKVLMINLQLFDDPLLKKEVMNNCLLEKIYLSNNYPLAYVYHC